jgi:hypothetical protein
MELEASLYELVTRSHPYSRYLVVVTSVTHRCIKARCVTKMDANGRTIVDTAESDRATLAIPPAIDHAF